MPLDRLTFANLSGDFGNVQRQCLRLDYRDMGSVTLVRNCLNLIEIGAAGAVLYLGLE